jgi:pimeloyl-ACP methyl ester carboxylesterase
MTLPEFQTGGLATADGAVKPFVMIGSGAQAMVIVPGAADGLVTCAEIGLYLAWHYRHRAEDCRLLILSRRDPLPADFGPERHALDMIATVQALGWGAAVWECVSMGGPIGQQAAILRPDLVRGLILSSSCDHLAPKTARAFRQWLSIVDNAGPGAVWSLLEPKYRPPAEVISKVDEEVVPRGPFRDGERFRRLLEELADFDQRGLLGRITRPVLVIGGSDDRIVPAEVQREMAARIPGAALELFAGYGHFNDMENPAYEKSVRRFVRQVSGSESEAGG